MCLGLSFVSRVAFIAFHLLLEEVLHRAQLLVVGSLGEPVHVVEDAEDVAAVFFLLGVDLLVLD